MKLYENAAVDLTDIRSGGSTLAVVCRRKELDKRHSSETTEKQNQKTLHSISSRHGTLRKNEAEGFQNWLSSYRFGRAIEIELELRQLQANMWRRLDEYRGTIRRLGVWWR